MERATPWFRALCKVKYGVFPGPPDFLAGVPAKIKSAEILSGDQSSPPERSRIPGISAHYF